MLIKSNFKYAQPTEWPYRKRQPLGGREGREEGKAWKEIMSPAEFTIFVLDCGSSSSSHKTDGTTQIRATKCQETKDPLIPLFLQISQSIPQSRLLNFRIGTLSIGITTAITVPHMLILRLNINIFKTQCS